MATFKAVNVDQLDTDLTNIASAIKSKSGFNESLEFPNGFIEAINNIAVGDEEVQNLIKKAQTYDWIQENFINYRKDSQCNLFANNQIITEVPIFDFSQVTNFSKLFFNCPNLLEIPQIDTSNGTNFSEMFRNSFALTTIPPINTEKGTNMFRMFSGLKITEIPWIINTSNCLTFERMFDNVTKIQQITLTSTNMATNFSYMFNSCNSLKTISTLDLSNCEDNTNMFQYCSRLENISFVPETIKMSITIPSANLTAESIQSIIDGLAIVETEQTLTLNAAIVLTDEQKTAIANKGWKLVQ